MSRSYASRPTVTNARGRGRGTQTRNYTATGPSLDDNANGASGVRARGTDGPTRGTGAGRAAHNQYQPQSSNNPQIGQRMTHQGAYTMITPNEKKREQVTEMAKKEQDAYASYKEKNTQKTFSYVGTVGGGHVTKEGARQQAVLNSPTKVGKLMERQERKSFLKQREEEELQKKKDAQRFKAQQNEETRKRDLEASANKWDNQMKRTNEAFLRRLENKSKTSDTGPPDGNGKELNVQATSNLPVTGTQQSTFQKQPIGQAPAKTTPSHMQGAVGGANNDNKNEYSKGSCEYSESSSNGLTAEEQKRLNALAMIFPHVEETVLIEILQQVGYSVDMAITLLQG